MLICLGTWFTASAFANPFQGLEDVVRQATSFNDFLAKPKLVEAYKAALQEYYGQQKFQCETFEDILSRLVTLNAQVPGFGEELWKVQDGSPVTAFRSEANPKAEGRKWELAPVPRKLHAIWNDPSQRGCVSEDCGKSEITAPERWAVGLPGSQAYLLHQDGKYRGAGLFVFPVVKGKEVFSLVTPTGTGPLQEKARYAERQGGGTRHYSMFDRFLDGWKGPEAVMVQYDRKDGAVGRMNRVRPAKGKTFAGFLDEFKPQAPMATAVAKAAPRKCFAKKESSINLFAGFGSVSGGGVQSALFNAGAIRDLLAQTSPNNVGNVADVPPEQKGQVGQALADILKGDKDAAIREKAARALRLLDNFGTEEGSKDTLPTRAPASVASDPAADAFRKGLRDGNPGVRGVSGAALASRGDSSPDVQRAIDEALNGTGTTPGGQSAGDVAAQAADGMNRGIASGGPGLSPDQLASLLGRVPGELDPRIRQALIDRWLDSLRPEPQDPQIPKPRPGPEQLERLAELDRRAAEEARDRANQRCENNEKLQKAIQEEKRQRDQRSRENRPEKSTPNQAEPEQADTRSPKQQLARKATQRPGALDGSFLEPDRSVGQAFMKGRGK